MDLGIENLLLIMVVVWGTGVLFRRMNLPILLGELLAGLLFGPALLGIFHDNETIQILAELGIFFLMLHAGLETNPQDLIKSSKTSLAIALGGVLLPFGLGTGTALLFGHNWITAIFIGMSLSITAIAVTTKVFTDFKYHKSPIAHMVMGAAILDDIIAFILLSILLGVVDGGGTIDPINILFVIGKVSLFFGLILFAGNKLIPVFKHVFESKGHKAFTFTLIIALLFGFLAELIGVHYILGAYLAGLFVKEEIVHPAVYHKIEDRLFGISYSFLGPIFFVSLGFHVDFSIFTHPETLLLLVAILLAAIIGKVFGAGIPARLMGKNIKESLIIGTSMNGRGAVELIIALIGLELGLINEQIFSVLIFMAFITTLMSPITLKYLLKSLGKKQIQDTEYEGM